MSDYSEVIIGEQMEPFTIITNKGWATVYGHSIDAFGYKFYAAPYSKNGSFVWSITEAESGAKLFSQTDSSGSGSYEEVMFFLNTVLALRIVSVMTKLKALDNFESLNQNIEMYRKNAVEKWGEIPVIRIQ